MKIYNSELLSLDECELIYNWFEDEKDVFKSSTDNGESYISAHESNLPKDFPYVHKLLKDKIENKVFPLLSTPFNKLSVKTSFGCRYSMVTDPSMPCHYDGDDFTVLIYLNRGFLGGGTSFPLLKKVLTVTDVGVGNCVIFPGLDIKSWHGALPITKGVRYTISVRLSRESIFYRIKNSFKIFILMPFTFLFNKYPTLYTK